MKTKLIKKVAIIICIMAMILPVSFDAIARITNTTKGTKLNFGISLLHTSKTLSGNKNVQFGYAIQTGAKPTYRIYSGSNDYETTVLCLNKDLRYPRENGESNAEYTSQGEANATTLNQAYSAITSDKANKILWLVRNAVIPEDSEELKDQKLAKIFSSQLNTNSANPLTLDEIKKTLTEDDLVFAMQFSIWQITNNVSLGALQGTSDGTTWDGLTGNDMWGYSGKKGAYIEALINYYKNHIDGDDIIKFSSSSQAPTFANTTVTTTYANGYAFIGPFRINSTNTDYSVKFRFYNQNGAELPNENFYLRKATTTKL